MKDFQDDLDQRGVDLYAAEKALERDRLALDEKAARLEEHIGRFNEAVLVMQGREADLYEREKALKDDLAALEASTPEGIKAARDEARKRNVLLHDTLRDLIKAMSSAEVALFAKSLRSPEQQQLVRAIMIGQGRDHGYGHGG
jgi:chromosome segregation ATPase